MKKKIVPKETKCLFCGKEFKMGDLAKKIEMTEVGPESNKITTTDGYCHLACFDKFVSSKEIEKVVKRLNQKRRKK